MAAGLCLLAVACPGVTVKAPYGVEITGPDGHTIFVTGLEDALEKEGEYIKELQTKDPPASEETIKWWEDQYEATKVMKENADQPRADGASPSTGQGGPSPKPT